MNNWGLDRQTDHKHAYTFCTNCYVQAKLKEHGDAAYLCSTANKDGVLQSQNFDNLSITQHSNGQHYRTVTIRQSSHWDSLAVRWAVWWAEEQQQLTSLTVLSAEFRFHLRGKTNRQCTGQ